MTVPLARSPVRGRRVPGSSRARLVSRLRVLLVVLLPLALLRAAGAESGTFAVLAVGLAPWVLLPGYPALLAGLLARDRLVAGAAAVVAAVHLLAVLPAVRPAAPAPVTATRLRVAVANLYVLNPDPRATGEALRALDLDVLVVPELTPAGLTGLRASGLLTDLPHRVVDPGAVETVGLFSRTPLYDVQVRAGAGRALPSATTSVAGRPVRVLSAHTLPPVGPLQHDWRRGLRLVARDAHPQSAPVVVLGDLNGDRDHAAVRALLRTGLRDVHDERGRGLARTWPAALPLLHLDHVLVRDGSAAGVVPIDVREVRLPGTDHLAVVADLAVTDPDPTGERRADGA